MPLDRLLTAPEVAERIGRSVWWVERAARHLGGASFRSPDRVLIRESALDVWARAAEAGWMPGDDADEYAADEFSGRETSAGFTIERARESVVLR